MAKLVRVYARSATLAQLDPDGDNTIEMDSDEYTESYREIVVDCAATAGPKWTSVTLTRPAEDASTVEIALDPDSTDASFEHYISARIRVETPPSPSGGVGKNTGWIDLGEITGDLSPVPTTIGDAETTHDYDAGYDRESDDTSGASIVSFEITARIVETSTGVVSDTRTKFVQWLTLDTVSSVTPQVEELSITGPTY